MKNKILQLYFNFKVGLLKIDQFIFSKLNYKKFKNPEKYIPKNTPFCNNCIFWKKLNFLPKNLNGYCYFLKKTDMELSAEYNKKAKRDKFIPSSFLHKKCKECNINNV